MAERIAIEVIHALPAEQQLLKLEVEAGTTVAQAIALSGLIRQLPPDWDQRVGIFGRLCDPQTVVRAGDRIEIYRELLADPKELRRARVSRQRNKR